MFALNKINILCGCYTIVDMRHSIILRLPPLVRSNDYQAGICQEKKKLLKNEQIWVKCGHCPIPTYLVVLRKCAVRVTPLH